MSEQLIAWVGPEGLALTVPAPGVPIESVEAAVVPPDAPRLILDREGLTDWDFSSAWTLSGKGIEVDMERARDVHRDRLRAAREPRLRSADVEFIRAIEAGDDAARTAVSALRQELRDLPQRGEIEAAKTPGELRAFWPSELVGPSPYGE